MDITQKKENIEYNDIQKKLLNIFKFNKEEISIKGSSNIKAIKNFADYDFYTKITRNYGSSETYDEFHKILKNILDNSNLYFIEFKMETNKGKKIRFYYNENFSYKEFNKYFDDNLNFCKIDIVYFSSYFIECSCIYDFNTPKLDENTYIKNLKKDITELKKENNYFKILKKMYLIYKVKNDFNKIEYLTKIFNSNLGLVYKHINNIDAIDIVKKYYNDPLTKKRIEHNLNEIGFKQQEVEKQYITEKKNLNEEAKKIYNQIK
jgi:hypothetical protein